MEGLPKQERGARFIGTIERFAEGWRASFRLHEPNEVFAQQGKTEVFATELQATKWLHTQATARAFSSIEIECTDAAPRHVGFDRCRSEGTRLVKSAQSPTQDT